MARLIRELDWSTRPIGPPETWPARLRAAVEMMLLSPLPMAVSWARPATLLYNDAFVPLAGPLHPGALGGSAQAGMPAAAAQLQRMVARVAAGESFVVRDQRLPLGQAATADARTYDLAISPLPSETGHVGLLLVANETTALTRTQTLLNERDARQTFLLALSDALRPLEDPAEVKATACRLLGERLGADRVVYLDVQGEIALVERDWAPAIPSMAGRHSLAQMGPGDLMRPVATETLMFDDVAGDHRLDERLRRSWLEAGIGAMAATRLVKNGRWAASLAAHSVVPRRWTPLEIALVEETAERAWEAVERARAQAARAASEARFRRFAEAASDGLALTAPGGARLEYASPAVGRIFGGGPKADGGQSLESRFLAMVVEEDRPAVASALGQARRSQGVRLSYRIRRPSDGEVRWLRLTAFPVPAEDGAPARWGAIVADVTEAWRAAERNELLVAELQHRTRNLLAVVGSVAARTFRVGGSAEDFQERLMALGRAQGLLSARADAPISLESLVRTELEAHGEATPDRIVIQGPEVWLDPAAVQNLALAMHELTTNAVKHGALSTPSGRLAISWSAQSAGESRRVTLAWEESGLAEVRTDRKGFGRQLLERALRGQGGGCTLYEIGPSGVRCRLEAAIAGAA